MRYIVDADLQAYFRDVTQEDLQVLLPAFHDPLEDPVYKVPPIGPHFSADDLILSPRTTRGLKAVGAIHSGKRSLVSYACSAHTLHSQLLPSLSAASIKVAVYCKERCCRHPPCLVQIVTLALKP